MIVKFLGILDVLAATILLFGTHAPKTIMMYVAVYLIVKGLLFSFTGDFISIVDVVIGLYAILIKSGHSWAALTLLFSLFLYQKGLFSFI